MRKQFFLVIFLLLQFAFCVWAKVSPNQVFYEVSPILQNNEAKLKIILSFQGDKTGVTTIKLPHEFAGQEQLYKCVQNLKVITPQAELKETDKPELKKITHLPNNKITIEYELLQDWQGNPSVGDASMNAGGGYRPIIKKDYFHLLGFGTWILPDFPMDTKLKVSIVWKDFPKEWSLANSFGASQTEQNFQANVSSLMSSVFVGGDFRVSKRLIKGKPIWTAIRGKWSFSDDEFTNLAQKVIGVEREFWNDFKHPYFLITLLPLESEANSSSAGGTGLTNSFATFITNNLDLVIFPGLLAHECFHDWNSRGFGGMKQPEGLLYWFSEGFTDYYTYRLLLKAELIDSEKYLTRYNSFLKDYYFSPVRNENNQRIVADFFKDTAVGNLPYRRGFLLATKWNQIIRQQSNGKKSLDDLMRNILQDARKKKIKELSKEYLLSLFAKYANYDFAADVEKYIEKGETIVNFAGVFGDCVLTNEMLIGKFELGFDRESLKTKVISGVLKDSAAYEAGVRDGQKIIERKPVYVGDPKKNVEMTIEENGEKKQVVYQPETKEKIAVPQFKLNGKGECLNTTNK